MWSELGKARHSKKGKAMFQLKGIEATPFSDNPMFFFVERHQCAVGAWNGWSPVSDIEGASNMCANHHKCVWLYFTIYIISYIYTYNYCLLVLYIFYYYHDALMPIQIPINTRSNSMWNSTDHPEENVEGSSCPSDIVGMCWEQAWKYGLRNSWKFTFYIILPRNIRKTTGTHGDSTWFRIGDCHAMHWRSRQAVSQSLQLPQLGTGCVVSCCVLG